MQVYFRVSKKAKEEFQIIENSIFISSKEMQFSLCPIPPFLDGSKCKCGKPANMILNDSECVCSDCVQENFVKSDINKEETIANPMTENSLRNVKFEWSITGSGWYTIYGRGLKPDNWTKFTTKLKYMILNNKSLLIEADYDRDKKELKITKF